jgi:hypothetical protein
MVDEIFGGALDEFDRCRVVEADRGGGLGADGGIRVVGEGATKGVPDGLSISEGERHGFWVGWRRLDRYRKIVT